MANLISIHKVCHLVSIGALLLILCELQPCFASRSPSNETSVWRTGIYQLDGNTDELRELLNKGLQQASLNHDRHQEAALLLKLGQTYETNSLKGNRERSRQLYSQAIELMKQGDFTKEQIVDAMLELEVVNYQTEEASLTSFERILDEVKDLPAKVAIPLRIKVLTACLDQYKNDLDVRARLYSIASASTNDDVESLKARAGAYVSLASNRWIDLVSTQKQIVYRSTARKLYERAGCFSEALSQASSLVRLQPNHPVSESEALVNAALKQLPGILATNSKFDSRDFTIALSTIIDDSVKRCSTSKAIPLIKSWLGELESINDTGCLRAYCHYLLGSASLSAGLIADARTNYQAAVKQFNQSTKSEEQHNLADLLKQQVQKRKNGEHVPIGLTLEQYEQAFQELSDVIEQEGSNFFAHSHRQNAEFELFKLACKMSDLPQAEKLYACLQSSQHSRGWYVNTTSIMMAQVYAQHGDLNSARACCRVALEPFLVNFCSTNNHDDSEEDEDDDGTNFLHRLRQFNTEGSLLDKLPMGLRPSQGEIRPKSMSTEEELGAIIDFLTKYPEPGSKEKIRHLQHLQAKERKESEETTQTRRLAQLYEDSANAIRRLDDDDPPQAITSLKTALESLRMIEGDVADLSASFDADGDILRERGYYRDAEEFLLRAKKIRQQGGESARAAEAQTLCHLAQVYLSQGKLTLAKDTLLKSIALREHKKADDEAVAAAHSDIVLGCILTAEGQYDEGRKRLKSACNALAPGVIPAELLRRFKSEVQNVDPEASIESLLPDAHPKYQDREYSDALLALGHLEFAARNIDTARDLAFKALEYRSDHGYYRRISAPCYELIARCNLEQKILVVASENCDQAMRSALIELNSKHPVVADILADKAAICLAHGDKLSAKAHFIKAEKILTDALGQDNPRAVRMRTLAND